MCLALMHKHIKEEVDEKMNCLNWNQVGERWSIVKAITSTSKGAKLGGQAVSYIFPDLRVTVNLCGPYSGTVVWVMKHFPSPVLWTPAIEVVV